MGTGSVAKNFQQGARSEYLAQYVFSAFGTAVPVPRPEDSGIDLKCTLGEQQGYRFWVKDYYYLQVKSDENDIVLESRESVEWLHSLKLPLFICLVSKSGLEIELFQTLGAYSYHSSKNLEKIIFRFNRTRNSKLREYDFDKMFPSFSKTKKEIIIDLLLLQLVHGYSSSGRSNKTYIDLLASDSN